MKPVISFWSLVGALLLALLVFDVSDWDMRVQSALYDVATHRWWLDGDAYWPKLVFYDGIKRVLIALMAGIFLLLLGAWRKPWLLPWRRGLLIVLLSGIVVPSVVASLKAVTNTACPRDVTAFNGSVAYVKAFERYAPDQRPTRAQKCLPAAHASAGFALFGLLYLCGNRRQQYRVAAAVLALGWVMGTYKMLIGDHFLSHTVISMLLSALLVRLIALAVDGVGRYQWNTRVDKKG